MSKLSLRRTTQAAFAEGAALATRVSPVRRAITGDDIRVTPINFYVARTRADDEALQWATFQGDPEAGRRRSSWKVGVVAVHGEVFGDELAKVENQGGKRAIAWALGNAILVGAVPKFHLHRWEGDSQFGMRVGPDDLRMASVIWLPDNTVMIPKGGLSIPEVVDGTSAPAQYATTVAVPNGTPIY